jgi:hypothetical protein
VKASQYDAEIGLLREDEVQDGVHDNIGEAQAANQQLEDALDAEAEWHQKITAQQIQMRIEQARVRIRAASLEDRDALLKEEVCKIKVVNASFHHALFHFHDVLAVRLHHV